MPHISDFKRLDWFALWIVHARTINNAPPREILESLMQYWGNQSNTATVFVAVLGTIATGLYLEMGGILRWTALPPVVLALYFALRSWAYGRCAGITCNIWK